MVLEIVGSAVTQAIAGSGFRFRPGSLTFTRTAAEAQQTIHLARMFGHDMHRAPSLSCSPRTSSSSAPSRRSWNGTNTLAAGRRSCSPSPMRGRTGPRVDPAWPHARYARASTHGAWADALPLAVEVHEWITIWTSGMRQPDVWSPCFQPIRVTKQRSARRSSPVISERSSPRSNKRPSPMSGR